MQTSVNFDLFSSQFYSDMLPDPLPSKSVVPALPGTRADDGGYHVLEVEAEFKLGICQISFVE
jgi:hypothetical protein